MGKAIRLGIIGAGWPGVALARAAGAAGGVVVAAVGDRLAERRAAFIREFPTAKPYASDEELLDDKSIEAVCVCLPNDLHAAVTMKAMKAGKHVLCESPPARDAREARRMEAGASKSGRVLLYGLQRRMGPCEQAAAAAIAKGYIGEPYHVRASWTRTRGVPVGTGWFLDPGRSGGGAMIDLGTHMLDLAWHLLGQPKPLSVFAATQRRLGAVDTAVASAPSPATAKPSESKSSDDEAEDGAASQAASDEQESGRPVEESAVAIVRCEAGQTIELAVAWAINQPPNQNGSICRVHGSMGAIEVYSPQGATLYRHFGQKTEPRATELRPPALTHHAALLRHFRRCIQDEVTPNPGAAEGVALMEMIDAMYKSARTGRSVGL
jgi:predicted dehydrogenase